MQHRKNANAVIWIIHQLTDFSNDKWTVDGYTIYNETPVGISTSFSQQ